MAKSKGLKNLAKILQKYQASVSHTLLNKIGEFVVSRIQSFTRIGKSIAGDTATSMSPYSQKYKIYRQEAAGRGKDIDPEWFRPGASNAQLVFTGQMLRSLTHIVNLFKKSVKIRPDGVRGDGTTNLQIAKHVSKTRPFIGLDKAGAQQVKRMIEKEIVKGLKKR